MRGLPVETSALTDERTTYISQETVPTATSYMTGSKSDIKRQKAHRDRRVEDWARISSAYQFAHLWSSGLICSEKQSHTEEKVLSI